MDEANLTMGERLVLDMLRLTGASNKDIGIALEMRPDTVKMHLKSVLRKLGLRNRTQAALFGVYTVTRTEGVGNVLEPRVLCHDESGRSTTAQS